ncbi:hypothetical protein [Rugosimonospora africana]|uniref:Uncharacterized protein n=1 Tax=Rugosimonospora africana TaxID=556532 RepID=A0A8J3R170_9ACTN|nr:hypothetical protein [Rugosimonospora africana]GIH19490.1 hypothetical protein Raf01_76620 [Rugosimonospora africana]
MSVYRVRVCDVVSTAWRATSHTAPVDSFDLAAEFAHFYPPSDAQLPTPLTRRVLARGHVSVGPGGAARAGEDPNLGDVDLGDAVRAEVVLFGLPVPVGQVVAAVLLDFDADEIAYTPGSRVGEVLAACVDDRLLLDGRQLPDLVADLALLVKAVDSGTGVVSPERHTLAFVHGDGAPVPGEPVVASLLYARHVALRPEFHSLRRPASLNRAEGEYAAVSRHASFLYEQPVEVENSVLLTTVQAVATSGRFRQIWYEAQQSVLAFQNQPQSSAASAQAHDGLEWMGDLIGNLEFDLAVNVEATSDVGLGSASRQIEDFHHDLYEAMRIPERSRTVGQTFTRLKSSLEAELIAIDTRERARATVSIEAIASLLSVVGFPIFFILAYLGVNAREVDGDVSMFSLRYWPVYTCAALLSVFALVLMFRRPRTRGRRR